MITDEELHEIAEELRIHSNCVGFESCIECQTLSTKLFGDRFVLCQLDDRDASYWGAVADLIDRPTCHLIEDEDGRTACSECGCAALYMSDATYCPDCGGVIVDD